MLNIIKADLYRIFRGKGVYIVTAVFISTIILLVVSNGQAMIGVTINMESADFSVEEDGSLSFIEKPKMTGKISPLESSKATDNLIYFMLPFIVFIAAADFSHGAVKNLLAGGSSRIKYYLSKLILTAALCIILTFIYVTLSILVATIMNGFGGSFDGEFVREVSKIFLPQLYLLFAYTCIGIFLTFTFKRVATLNTAYIAFSLVPILILSILAQINDTYSDFMKYDLIYSMKSCADAASNPDYTLIFILGSIYILASTFGGIMLFRRSEIK